MSMTKKQYDRAKAKRDAQFTKLAEKNPGAMAYIVKRGYYYRPNSCGYTEFRHEAGLYPINDAVDTCISCSLEDRMHVVPVNPVEHNAMLLHEIQKIMQNYIPESKS